MDTKWNYKLDTIEDIQRMCVVDPTRKCWIWQGPLVSRKFYPKAGHVRVHRLVLELKLGRELVPGEQALHSCDVTPCCSPEHIFVGTYSDNMKDRWNKGRTILDEKTKKQERAKWLVYRKDASSILESLAKPPAIRGDTFDDDDDYLLDTDGFRWDDCVFCIEDLVASAMARATKYNSRMETDYERGGRLHSQTLKLMEDFGIDNPTDHPIERDSRLAIVRIREYLGVRD